MQSYDSHTDGTDTEEDHSTHGADSDVTASQANQKHKTLILFGLLTVAYFSCIFGHGSTIGIAVSLKGNSKAMNLALSSWTMGGLCIGLLVTPWACRMWGVYRVWIVCSVFDLLVILMMLWPGITLQQIYAIRFLIGFFEAPFLPYLQEWLAQFASNSWNLWNAIMHSAIPFGENFGYLVAQELVVLGYNWQYAFAGQVAFMSLCLIACCIFGGGEFLDVSRETQVAVADDHLNIKSSLNNADVTSNADHNGQWDGAADFNPSVIDEEFTEPNGKYPVTERWAVFWATTVSLGAQVTYMCGVKLLIREYSAMHGFQSVHFTVIAMSLTSLLAPFFGGAIVLWGGIIKPDQWSQHKRTLLWLACTSSVASAMAVLLPYTTPTMFWPTLFLGFAAAGGVYPAAQGIINTALTATRVVDASVYQQQCYNLLFAIPFPYCIGKSIDVWGADTSFQCLTMLQVIAASGFALALLAAACTDERRPWPKNDSHRSGTLRKVVA